MNRLKKVRMTEVIALGEASAQIMPNVSSVVKEGYTLSDLSRDRLGDPLDNHGVAFTPWTVKRIVDLGLWDCANDESIFVFAD
jgi:hypothetical protein